MHVYEEIENDPEGQAIGTNELIMNFTFEERK